MAKCLVTGASGFIGTHLVRRLLAHGHDVVALARRSSQLNPLSDFPIQVAYGDVTDRASMTAALAGCDVVYHVAGLTKAMNAQALFAVNERGCENLMRACIDQNREVKVVLVSSLAAAGPAINGRPVEPSDPPHPVSDYGRSKLAGEAAVRHFAYELPITIVRPPFVFGEGDRLSLELFQLVKRLNVHLVPGLRREYFSMIHADDLVELLIAAAERGQRVTSTIDDPRGVYFAADAETPTFADIGRMIGKGLGRWRNCRIIYTPKRLVWLIAAINELTAQVRRKPASLNFDKYREAIAGSWTCSPRAAQDELGWNTGASLAERFKQTVDWYKANGWL